jgi:NAD(P)-dependent dehydrogenase (short-subunit alcohol dehydrogenase family)
MNWLHEKRLVIIGGTTGLGLSAAIAFIKEGARVVVVGRSEESVTEANRLLNKNGFAFSGDACNESVAQQAIDACIEKFNGFDGLYHVAGGSGRRFGDGPLHELSLEGWNKTFEINLTALMLSNRAAAQTFLKEKPQVLYSIWAPCLATHHRPNILLRTLMAHQRRLSSDLQNQLLPFTQRITFALMS